MLRQRVITALCLLAGLLATLFILPRPLADGVFALIAALAAWEWAGLLGSGQRGRQVLLLVTIPGCLGLYFFPPIQMAFLIAAAVFWLIVAPLWLLLRWRLRANFLGFAVGLLILLPTWVAMTELNNRSPWLLLGCMALVWVADIAAYFCGRAFGRHKLAPDISPGKTWEGVAGAIAGVLVYGFTLICALGLAPDISIFVIAVGLVLLTAASIIGDLHESMLKRHAGLKDSSQLLPGHGGILDRIDSLLSTLPLLAISLKVALT